MYLRNKIKDNARILVVLMFVLAMAGCNCNKEKPYPLHSGDLLFQANKNSRLVDAIINSTTSFDILSFSNVGIVIEENSNLYVIVANTVNGVEIMQLETFLKNSATTNDHKPMVIAKRLQDTTCISESVKRAKALVGKPFDIAFLPNNEAIYGSELVYESYLDNNNNPLFSAHQMFFRDSTGNTSQQWISFFESYNLEVPIGEFGTNPNDMANEPILKEVYRFF